MILPGKTLGILGGGQLGRMLAQAAQRLGYRVHVYEPAAHCPAGEVCAQEVNAPYTDGAALAEFARGVDVLTYEFENIPVEPLNQIAGLTPLYPRAEVLHISQNRSREKAWLRAQAIPHARYVEVAAGGDLRKAINEVSLPCVVKTADFGYDGKGQLKITDEATIAKAITAFADQRAVVEQWIDFACEVSVVVARSSTGEVKAFPVAENIHTHHILDFSLVPARVSPGVEQTARALGCAIAEKLQVVGLLAVELFVTKQGELLVNELAPRPHNSGHYTLDACATSQFEQQVRAVCGLPLGDVRMFSPVVMVNILGDAWAQGEPAWEAILGEPGAKLHLYGKKEARPGRKMGHFTVMAETLEMALIKARELKKKLARLSA